MSKLRILICAATPFELLPVIQFLERQQSSTVDCQTLVHGVGLPASVFSLTQHLHQHPFDLVIQIGLTGSLDASIDLGTVVQVTEECFMDLGAEEKDGSFISLFDLGLNDPDQPPFTAGKIAIDPAANFAVLPKVKGGTVNLVSGTKERIAQLRKQFPAVQVESMEGGAAAYVCASLGLPLLQIRAISNFVEPRNRDSWKIELAMKNLGAIIVEMLEEIFELHKA